jgi:ribosomal protein S18 acetylase RimI-like enzyme
MTAEEFAAYEDLDAHHYAENMVRAGFWASAGAYIRAKEVHTQLLPGGMHTENHLFFVIESLPNQDAVGVIWLYVDRQVDPPSGFIYDLLIHEPFRGQGWGKGAMLAVEQVARDLGLSSLFLNVFEHNQIAKALYISLGYQVQSLSMRKLLSSPEGDVV